jgi:hypothetical protein
MSTLEVLGLRKHKRAEKLSSSVQSKSVSRQHTYLKDMLVAKFLSKNKIEHFGKFDAKSRELEIQL